jgi:hypothetical protein
MSNKRVGYSLMYMVPPSIWELVKKCVNDLEAQRIEQLNISRNIQPIRTRSDQILSNISSMDINPIDDTLHTRNLSPIPDETTEYSSHDIPMFEPPKDFSTQTNFPTENISQITNISSQTEAPLVTYPDTSIDRSSGNIPNIEIPKSITFKKPPTVTFKDINPLTYKKPLPISYKKPITYSRKRKMENEYIEPLTIPDPFIQNQPTQDYTNLNVTQEPESFGILPPPEYRSSEFEFNPSIYSTPISSTNIPKRTKPKPSRIPIPILPLPSCTPKPNTISKLQKQTLSTINPSSKLAISKPQLSITHTKQKAITTKSLPQLTYSQPPIQTRSKSKAIVPISSSSIQTRSKSRALVKSNSYICPLCGIEFTTQVNMERHMRVLHNATAKNYDKWKK